ncbi:MAG: amidohydrolase [Deltaproteobacteria bacterium]|nr:amidohydrolase [Deltaproteobacteria bacterium]
MEKRLIICLSLIFVLTVAMSAFAEGKATNYADMILFNGKIYTVDKDFSKANAVAIKTGRFLAVGSNDVVSRYEGPETEKIDLKGLAAIPGLMDTHIHFTSRGGMLTEKMSRNTVESILEQIKEKVSKAKPGEWINTPYFWGFDKKLPAKVIDTVSPDNQVHMCGGAPHKGIMNSKAMEALGIRKGAKIDGGGFDVDENGEPTGIVRGYANVLGMQYYRDSWKNVIAGRRPSSPPFSVETYKERIRAAMKEVNMFGLTSINQQGANFTECRAFREIASAGESTVRAQADIWMMIFDYIPLKEIDEYVKQLSFITHKGLGDEWFKISGIKSIYDGASSMYDFEDMRLASPKRFKEFAEIVAKHGLRLVVHAHGDRAIDHLLDAYEYAHKRYPIDKMRWTALHHSFPTPDDYPRIKKMGLVVNSQPMFIHTNYFGDYVKKNPKLENIYYPNRSELEAGIKVGFSSDCTSLTFDPFIGIQIAVTRKAPLGKNKGWVVNEKEKISRRQALECYTINNAYLMFEEDVKGSIEPGKFADMVVIDKDIMTVPEDDIRKINVEMTIVGGKVVYRHELGTKYPRHPYWSWL